MTPPPAANSPTSTSISSHAIPTALSDSAPAHAATQPKSKDENGRLAFHALCIEQRRLVTQFLALEKPPKPEILLETLHNAQARTRRTLAVIQEALKRFRLDALSLSYNGGKDCLVLLVLYLAALADIYPPPNSASKHTETKINLLDAAANHSHSSASDDAYNSTSSSAVTFPTALPSVYIEAPHPFPELTAFVEASVATYRLALVRHSGEAGLRAAFAAYCAQQPDVHAILVGTRRSDPHGAHLDEFQPTDHGWPVFVRVLPMLEWHYEEIWAFLRALDIPYCELYDQGYTSLGGTKDTRPNPALKRSENSAGTEAFAPAYELFGDAQERLGRDR